MELIGEIVGASLWVWIVASACFGMGVYALVVEARERFGNRASKLVPSPSRRLEQFEQMAHHAKGRGVNALAEIGTARADATVRWFLEIARRGMPSTQLKSCLDGEIEHRLANSARLRRWAAFGAAAFLGFGLCGLGVAIVFALRQSVVPGSSPHLVGPAALGIVAGLCGIPAFCWLRNYSRRSESMELLDLTLVATGIEAIARGDEPHKVRASLGQLIPSTHPSAERRNAA